MRKQETKLGSVVYWKGSAATKSALQTYKHLYYAIVDPILDSKTVPGSTTYYATVLNLQTGEIESKPIHRMELRQTYQLNQNQEEKLINEILNCLVTRYIMILLTFVEYRLRIV